MQQLINKLRDVSPTISFRAGTKFYWSPETNEVVYNKRASGGEAIWALLHETSHALLEHASYDNDFELLAMEVAAWERAKTLAHELNMTIINEDHIQDCLDTYRDWLHKRCLCPLCGSRSFQKDTEHYHCYNCSNAWRVTPSRFCRAYRLNKGIEPLSKFAT